MRIVLVLLAFNFTLARPPGTLIFMFIVQL
jgi:hypothetical protein